MGYNPPATSTSAGPILLAQDISGTATAPTVPELVVRKYGNLNIIGHSYTAGTTQTDSGVSNVYQESVIAKLQSLLGIHESNVNHFGQAGSRLSMPTNPITSDPFGGWAGAMQFIVPNNSTNINAAADKVVTDPPVASIGLNLIVHSVNDFAIDWTSATLVNAAQPAYAQNAYAHGLRSTLARMRMGTLYDASVAAGAITWDASFSFAGGTWSDVASVTQNSGAAYKQSATNNDTVVFTIPTNFRGGYVDMSFIGQQAGLTTLTTTGGTINGATGTTGIAMAVAAAGSFPSTNGFVVQMGTEQFLVTAGAGTTSWTVTRAFNGTAATTHAQNDVVLMAQNMSVAYSTNGSNATITGSTKLGGQGLGGQPVAIVKRFLCTTADSGKTITMTFSGIPASDTFSRFWFDSAGLEAEDPPTVVVTNLHPWDYGSSLSSLSGLVSGWNTNISTVVAEFDSFVQVADVYTPFFNRGGVTTGSLNNTDATDTVGWTCNSTSFTPTVGRMFSFGRLSAEHVLCTAVSGSAPNWTLTITRGAGGTSKVAHGSGAFLAPLSWMSQIDDIHLSNSGHSVYATTIYNVLKNVTANTIYQQALNDGNFTQNSQTFVPGVVDDNWVGPNASGGSSSTVTQNRQTAYPIYISRTCLMVGVATIAAASSAGTIRYGIYLPDASGTRPGRLVQDFGAFNYASGTDWSTTGVYQILRPGWYWLSAAVQATAVSMRCFASNSLVFPYLSSTSKPASTPPYGLVGYGQTGISGALADWATYTELAGGTGASASGLIISYQLRVINRN